MNQNCTQFRARLSAYLANPIETERDQSLAWNEHLLGCTACRQLLESEQALDDLLGHVPHPALSQERRQMLLARLTVDARLEALLDLGDPFESAPAGLPDRIRVRLQGAAHTSESKLDQHLEAIRHIEAPAGLAQRVSAYCKAQGLADAETLAGDLAGSGRELRSTTGGPSLPAPVAAQAKRTARQGKSDRKPVLRHWLSTGLAAAGLAAILWYLPGTDAPHGTQGPSDGIDHSVAVKDPDGTPETDGTGDSDIELLAMLDTLELMEMVDELDAEEWQLLEAYDSYALLMLDGEVTDGDVMDGDGAEDSGGPR